MIERAVFRLGVHEVGPGYFRLRNLTIDALTGKPYDTTITLTPEQEIRWREYIRHWQHQQRIERLIELAAETTRTKA